MAWECPSYMLPGIEAGADLSAKQYYCVKLNSSGKAVLASVAGESVVGILNNKPTSGVAAQIMAQGVSKAIVGTAGVTANSPVAVDANGAIVNAAGSDVVVGVALETGTLAQLVPVLIARA
jgi:hypothetical protein